MELRLVSCEKPVFTGKVLAVYAKSPLGWFGVLPKHAAAVFLLSDSPVRIQLPEGEKSFHVRGGVLHVREDQLTLVAEEVQYA